MSRPRGVAAAAIFSAVLFAAAWLAAPAAAAPFFLVSSNGTQADNNIGDGTCATAVSSCTLRAAIQEANATTNATVRFDIGSSVIVDRTLPTITGSGTVIDGTTTPGYAEGSPVVNLTGADGALAELIQIGGPSITVKGMHIYGPDMGAAVYVKPTATNALIESNWLGGDNAATQGGSYGLLDTGSGTKVNKNVITDNRRGINVTTGSTGLMTTGNTIGTNLSNSTGMGNGQGITIDSTAANVTIGDVGSGRNIITGNSILGVGVSANGTRLYNNYINLDSTGATKMSSQYGIIIAGATGVYIGAGSPSFANTIVGGATHNIWMHSNAQAEIAGNYIGTNPNGTLDGGAGTSGIQIDTSSAGTVVGGPAAGQGNIIRNNAFGVRVESAGVALMRRNSVYDNSTSNVTVSASGVPTAATVASAVNDGAHVTVDAGIKNVGAGGTYKIDAYTTPTCSSNSQLVHFLGSQDVVADGSNNLDLSGLQFGLPEPGDVGIHLTISSTAKTGAPSTCLGVTGSIQQTTTTTSTTTTTTTAPPPTTTTTTTAPPPTTTTTAPTTTTTTTPAPTTPAPVGAGTSQLVDPTGNVVIAPTAGTGTVAVAPTATGNGSYSVNPQGVVTTAGDAVGHGSLVGVPLNAPVTGITTTPTGGGYYLTAADGGVFAFGDAQFSGSMANVKLNKPVTNIISNCGGGPGYWLVAEDGGVFAFGGAPFYGSLASAANPPDITGLVRSGIGDGYFLVDRANKTYAFAAS